MIAQVFGSGKASSHLTVEERLSAIGSGLDAGASEDFWLLVGAGAGVLLLIAIVAWILVRARRARWVAHHVDSLSSAGLHDEELALFRRLARRSEASTLPLLTRRFAAFDASAAELVRRHRPPEERRDLLARLLALRRRVPFERRFSVAPAFEKGLAVLLFLRVGRGEPQRLPGRIVAVPANGLQLSLDDEPETRALAPRLRSGQEAALVIERGSVFEEARVRIRGVGEGPLPQLLVDRPVALSPSRVRIVWHGAEERVRVEMLERFSQKLVIDAAPVVVARIVAASSEGVIVRFKNTRPRHGESIRILDGGRSGYYRGFVALDPKGSGGEVFLMQRGGDVAPPEPAGSRSPEMEEAAS